MAMTLSHCVVDKVCETVSFGGVISGVAVATGVAAGVADGVAAGGDSSTFFVSSRDFLSRSFAMMLSASANFCFCSSRACRLFSALTLPAATRLGFLKFTLVVGTFEVTC